MSSTMQSAVLFAILACVTAAPLANTTGTYHARSVLKSVNGTVHVNIKACLYKFVKETYTCEETPLVCDTTNHLGEYSFQDLPYGERFCVKAIAEGQEHSAFIKRPAPKKGDRSRRASSNIVNFQAIPVPTLYPDEWSVSMWWDYNNVGYGCSFDLVVVPKDYTATCVGELYTGTVLCEEDIDNFIDIMPAGSYSVGDLDYCGLSDDDDGHPDWDYEGLTIREQGTRKFAIFVYARHGADFFDLDVGTSQAHDMGVRVNKLFPVNGQGIQVSGTQYYFPMEDADFTKGGGRFWHIGDLKIDTDVSLGHSEGWMSKIRNKIKCTPKPATGSNAVLTEVEENANGNLNARCDVGRLGCTSC